MSKQDDWNKSTIDEFRANSGKVGGPFAGKTWYYNILAHPLVEVEIGTEQFQARAEIASEPERTRLYNKMVEMMPGFAEYQRKTSRVIPVITLTRVK